MNPPQVQPCSWPAAPPLGKPGKPRGFAGERNGATERGPALRRKVPPSTHRRSIRSQDSGASRRRGSGGGGKKSGPNTASTAWRVAPETMDNGWGDDAPGSPDGHTRGIPSLRLAGFTCSLFWPLPLSFPPLQRIPTSNCRHVKRGRCLTYGLMARTFGAAVTRARQAGSGTVSPTSPAPIHEPPSCVRCGAEDVQLPFVGVSEAGPKIQVPWPRKNPYGNTRRPVSAENGRPMAWHRSPLAATKGPVYSARPMLGLGHLSRRLEYVFSCPPRTNVAGPRWQASSSSVQTPQDGKAKPP